MTTWTDNAACHGQTNIMYPDTKNPADTAKAKAVCATCPVTQPCAQAAVGEPYGIWAGTTPEERGYAHPPKQRNRPRLNLVITCQWCSDRVHSSRRNQKWCDNCRPKAQQRAEAERQKRLRIRNQTTG